MRDDRLRLFDIIEAIERIEQYASQGFVAFNNQELIQVWVVHHLQIIGEAAGSLGFFLSATPRNSLGADYRYAQYSGA
jgi:uncharacterized protein with HEPN domain